MAPHMKPLSKPMIAVSYALTFAPPTTFWGRLMQALGFKQF